MPASRSARAMIFAPRSWPSSPGFATTTRILRAAPVLPPAPAVCSMARGSVERLPCRRSGRGPARVIGGADSGHERPQGGKRVPKTGASTNAKALHFEEDGGVDPAVARNIAHYSHTGQRDRFGEATIEHVERVAGAVGPADRAIAY